MRSWCVQKQISSDVTNLAFSIKFKLKLKLLIKTHLPLWVSCITKKYFLRLYLCQIKGIELPVFRLLEGHHLDKHSPGREVSRGDGIVEVPENVNINLIFY